MCEICDVASKDGVVRNTILDAIKSLGEYIDFMKAYEGLFSDNEARLCKILTSFCNQAKDLSKMVDRDTVTKEVIPK